MASFSHGRWAKCRRPSLPESIEPDLRVRDRFSEAPDARERNCLDERYTD